MKASEIKRHAVVSHDKKIWQIRDVERSAPTGRGGNTTFRFSMYQVGTTIKLDLSLRADDELEELEMTRRPSNFSYMDGDNYVFLDNEDYTPYTLSPSHAPDLKDYLIDGLDGFFVMVVDDQPVALQLPQFVELTIVDTPPYLRGASATGRTKTAKLQTGLELQVPEFVENGEKVRVATETGEYAGRAG
jgi:elongation factor P